MSLDAEQRSRTARDLAENLALAQVDGDAARDGTGLDAQRWAAALAVSADCRPEDVWVVRDRVEALARSAGREPVPFTVLTEDARAAASTWFPLR